MSFFKRFKKLFSKGEPDDSPEKLRSRYGQLPSQELRRILADTAEYTPVARSVAATLLEERSSGLSKQPKSQKRARRKTPASERASAQLVRGFEELVERLDELAAPSCTKCGTKLQKQG